MNGRAMKQSLLILMMSLVMQAPMFAESVSSKSYHKRIELLTYLRELEPIVKISVGKIRKENLLN